MSNKRHNDNNRSSRPKFNFISDIISGSIMAFTSIPQLIAYAETVGYASYRGLSTAGFSLIVWGICTGSPYMNSGVTSITALMTKVDLNGEQYLLNHTEEQYVDFVSAYSFWVGLSSILLALGGFGKLAKLTPKPVRAGFKWGCSLGVVISALPNGLLHRGSSTMKLIISNEPWLHSTITYLKTNFTMFTGAVNVLKILFVLTHPKYWSLKTTLMFIMGTIYVMNGKKLLPKQFPPGSEVIILTALATFYSTCTNYTGGIVGEIPAIEGDNGISLFNDVITIPVEIRNVKHILLETSIEEQFGGSYLYVLISSTIFAAINFLSIMGIASNFEILYGIQWNPSREMFAQGMACFASGLTGSAPVSGSLSRSLVSKMTGTTSQLACIVTGLIWIFALKYMNIMSTTPKSILSSVIISAVITSVCQPKELMKLQKHIDFIAGWLTAIVTALSSPTIGFAFGIVLSLLLTPLQQTQKTKKVV